MTYQNRIKEPDATVTDTLDAPVTPTPPERKMPPKWLRKVAIGAAAVVVAIGGAVVGNSLDNGGDAPTGQEISVEATEQGGSELGEGGGEVGEQGSETGGGGEAAEAGHSETGGEGGGSGEPGESGTQYTLNQTFDEVQSGARLILAYDAQTNTFNGTVENTTNNVLSQVRVEVHLSNGVELGPTTPTDLAPGQTIDVSLAAPNANFTTFSAHPEVG